MRDIPEPGVPFHSVGITGKEQGINCMRAWSLHGEGEVKSQIWVKSKKLRSLARETIWRQKRNASGVNLAGS